MESISRVHSVIFASGDNPVSTIEFVEKRGIDLFDDFLDEVKEFNPEFEKQENSWKKRDFFLPVLVGGRNGSGKTSLLRAIKIACDLLQTPNISKADASEAWLTLKSMNISYLSLLFSAIIPELTDEKKLSFTESVTKIVMDSTDKDETIKWCDGIQIRNPNLNIYEVEMYHKFGKFSSKKGKYPHKAIIGKRRIEKFIANLGEQTEKVSEKGPHLGFSSIIWEVNNVLSRLENTEYIQHEINFQEAIFIDVDRKKVEKEIEWMKELVPKIANRFDKLTKNPIMIFL